MKRTAHIDGDYRYSLDRHWGADEASTSILHLLMLNPSTADGLEDDPTIRRCIGFARGLGFDGLKVVNLFALRSTDPRGLRTHEDPIGSRNNEILAECMNSLGGSYMVAAWGADTSAVERAKKVHEMAAARNVALKTWKKTKDGHPWHPLYLPRDAVLTDWAPGQDAISATDI